MDSSGDMIPGGDSSGGSLLGDEHPPGQPPPPPPPAPQAQAQAMQYQTLRSAAAVAAQLAETHQLLGGCLRGDLEEDDEPPLPDTTGGSGAKKAAHTIVPSIKTALLRDENLQRRFGPYYDPSGDGASHSSSNGAAAAAASVAAIHLPVPCRGHGGAVRIVAAARTFEEECARQHGKQMQKWRRQQQRQQGQVTTMSTADAALLQRHLAALLRAVRAESESLLANAAFVEKILSILAAPPHSNSFETTSLGRFRDRLGSVRAAATVALHRGGEDGCELERVGRADMRLAGSGQPGVGPALWAPTPTGGRAPSTPAAGTGTGTSGEGKAGSSGKRKRSASKKMIEAENDAAYEQRMEMERKLGRQQQKQRPKTGAGGGGGGGGGSGSGKKMRKRPSPRSSPKFPHPSTANKILPGYSGGSSPEAANATSGTNSGSKRQQLAGNASSSASASSRLGLGRDVPPRPNVTIVDSNLNRITNPLLALPLYPRGVTGPNGTSTAPGRSSIVAAARVAGMAGGDASSSSAAAAAVAGKGGNASRGSVASGAAAAFGGEGVAIGAAGLPFRPDLIPHGGEMWSVMELYDPKIVDTFPLSYLARLLGFDVPHSVPESDVAATAESDVAALFAGTEMEAVVEAVTAVAKTKEGKSIERAEIKPFQKFDPATVKLMKNKDDIWMTVPKLGQFASIIRSNKRQRLGGATGPTALEEDGDSDDFFDLDIIDPIWKAILSDRALLSGGSEVKIRQTESIDIPAAKKAEDITGADSDTNAVEPSSDLAQATLLKETATDAAVAAPTAGKSSASALSDPQAAETTVDVGTSAEPSKEGASLSANSDTCSLIETSAAASASSDANPLPPARTSASPADKSSSLSVRIVPITFGVGPNVKLANGSYYQFISDQCLNCAKELVADPFTQRRAGVHDDSSPDRRVIKLLREGCITFRIATVGDEELLHRLNKNKTRFHSVADYAYALRSGHFFIIALEKIVADSKAEGTGGSADTDSPPKFAPLGYIHYNFCWYKIGAIPKDDVGTSISDQTSALYGVTSTASSLKPSTVSELVFGIDEIQCAPGGLAIFEEGTPGSASTSSRPHKNMGSTAVSCDFLPIVLTALALEHVRGNDIWYGIANVTTSSEAQLLKKYFRMTPLLAGDDETSPSSDGYPLACDMKKSSFRFAFLRYLDEERKRAGSADNAAVMRKTPRTQPAVRDRMLVRLPDAKTLRASLKISSLKNGDVPATGSAAPPPPLPPTPQSVSVGTGTTIQIGLADGIAGPSAAVSSAIGETEMKDEGVVVPHTTHTTQPVSAITALHVSEEVAAPKSQVTDESSQKADRPVLSFTSASTKVRSKTVGVRVSFTASAGGDSQAGHNATVQLLSAANQTSPVNDGQLFSDNPTWKVLRTFALPGAYSVETDTAISSPSTDASPDTSMPNGDGTILAGLLRKQEELRKLEDSFEPKLRSLLTQAYQERVEHEAQERVEQRAEAKASISKYEAEISRKREADSAWQAQLEQDMDAVCDVCLDGDVTVDNQILFCESCNVAIHQACYGISRVPAGDYFCKACLHFGRDKEARAQASRTAVAATAAHLRHKPLNIYCELCPRRQGAFVRATWEGEKESDNPNKAKWVHVTCSKWMGLNYRDEAKKDVIVDAIEVRDMFRNHDEYYQCYLCESGRGAFNKCDEDGCNNWLHVQCARLSGTCRVVHGENCLGEIDNCKGLGWKVWCSLHSGVAEDDIPKGSLSKEQLKAAADTFPPEPRRPPPPDAFDRLSGKDRAKFWADPTRQKQMIERLTGMVEGARCAVCFMIDPTDQFDTSGRSRNRLATCSCCGVVVHRACYMGPPPRSEKEFVCQACQYVAAEKDNEKYQPPQCHMCNMKGGVLRKAKAIPGSKKRFKGDQKGFEQTLFGKQIWCHSVCAMWSHHVEYTLVDDINCSQLIMANGTSHVGNKYRCDLCGRKDGVKFSCTMKECYKSGGAMVPFRFHLSCGRQAGLDIHDADNDTQGFYIKCFHHVRCSEVVRARMEDMLEVEKRRSGKLLEKAAMPMAFRDAAQLMHWSVTILSNLGWAWRWADWWVERGDNWEPLLEKGEKEENMTKEQLKIVDSTSESRSADARKCRLAAFGAALRNRDYDKEEGDDTVALDKALRAVLDTPSLVGPLLPHEKDFYAEWLGRAYRSKSPLLGFGDDKIPVDEETCIHIEDKSPKYILGNRPLPGKPLPAGGEGFTEVDDFLRVRPEPVSQSTPPPKRGGGSKKRSMDEDGSATFQPRRWSSRAKASVKEEPEPETPLAPSPKKAKRTPDADGKYRRPSGRPPVGKIWDYDLGEWLADPETEVKEESEKIEEEATSEGVWTCLKCGIVNAETKRRCQCKAWPPKKDKSPTAKGKSAASKDDSEGFKKMKATPKSNEKKSQRCRVDGCNKFKQANCDEMCRAHWRESLETEKS